MIQLVVSILLFFVLFFGIAFILNMLLRQSWLMAFLYPVIILLIVDDFPLKEYFTAPGQSFPAVWDRLLGLTMVDIAILLSGFIGTIVSGVVIRMLRKSGYQMF
ncbi:YuiB family protein [Sediminibacillus albus]|uniref:Putative membrane protein n=1 Tax=Sediminibacillus albus TaxID=407036 RepID=A0A1G8YZ19_9BACI|nr:YuiB family protein [Sediminibacillus albus]SDK08031.1 Putative membrane protein [Sediminibacillus albus]